MLPESPSGQAELTERIVSAFDCEHAVPAPEGVQLQTFVSERCGATGFSTGIASFAPDAYLPYHLHEFSEAVTVVEGRARILVEGRMYRLNPQDCVHLPAGVAHQVENDDKQNRLVAHWAFATARPSRTLVEIAFGVEDRGFGEPAESAPETIVRYRRGTIYELSQNAFFCDLFARRLGSVGICGGYGKFLPGASLPCHTHDFDESITIVKGSAICRVQGKEYDLSGCDTAFIPRGRPHRFLNQSNEEMAMIWVYAGDEPDRQIVNAAYCTGEITWPGSGHASLLVD